MWLLEENGFESVNFGIFFLIIFLFSPQPPLQRVLKRNNIFKKVNRGIVSPRADLGNINS
jgi:hypothetical protein